MKNGGVKIIAGYTVIEIKNKLNTFTAGEIRLMDRIRQGYTPDTSTHQIQTLYCILWRRGDKGVHMLYLHSEKLAIAFGL